MKKTGRPRLDRLDKALAKEKVVEIYVAIIARFDTTLLRKYLGSLGMHVTLVEQGDLSVTEALSSMKFDVIITDLPENQDEVLSYVRKLYAFAYPGIIVCVTGNLTASKSVLALEGGASCCFSNISSYNIIAAQIQAIMRIKSNTVRSAMSLSDRKITLDVGDYSVNTALGKLYYKGRNVPMSPDGVAILAILADNKDNIVNQHTICMKVYGSSGTKPMAMLKKQIKVIRNALGMDQSIELLRQPKVGYGISVSVKY